MRLRSKREIRNRLMARSLSLRMIINDVPERFVMHSVMSRHSALAYVTGWTIQLR